MLIWFSDLLAPMVLCFYFCCHRSFSRTLTQSGCIKAVVKLIMFRWKIISLGFCAVVTAKMTACSANRGTFLVILIYFFNAHFVFWDYTDIIVYTFTLIRVGTGWSISEGLCFVIG